MSANPTEPPPGSLPSWERTAQGEHRWHAAVLMLAVIALQLLLPHSLVGFVMIPVAVVELVLLAAIVIINPRRMVHTGTTLRVLGFVLLIVATLATAFAVARLVAAILGDWAQDPSTLLLTGADVWLVNVIIFGFWFWELDRGGPVARAVAPNPLPDFLFPQMTVNNEMFREWQPRVFDYVYVSFTNATAFSPTDAMPLSRWAKLAMLLEAAIALVTLALVVARAVNILT